MITFDFDFFWVAVGAIATVFAGFLGFRLGLSLLRGR